MLPDKVVNKFYEGLRHGEDSECWPYEGGGHNRRGWHRTIYAGTKYRRRTYMAHRVAYELTYGEIPDGLFVLHQCDNPVCCNPRHLFLGTQSENAKDMWAKNRANPGSLKGKTLGPSPHRKFDGCAVLAMYKDGFTQKQIASYFGCSDVAISVFLRKQPEAAHLVGRNGGAAVRRREKTLGSVLALRKSGKTQREVATALGISQAFVSKLENENGATNADNT